ncbi:MAG: fluoride efflux transporter CrcB [Dysgonamonadaceae bacterium]|jgi:CrcB protein|nr:fluoride efflux transporter CrcB [Dysgonamonadaceae bacterium]
MLKQIIFVGLGGGIGSIFRFAVSKYAESKGGGVFPWATFTVNILGCLLIGVLFGFSAKQPWFDSNMKALFMTGFCGGFTTFSAFSLENVQMYQSGNFPTLAVYVAMSIIVGFLAVYAGIALTNLN